VKRPTPSDPPVVVIPLKQHTQPIKNAKINILMNPQKKSLYPIAWTV
jgi:hypothetical protein